MAFKEARGNDTQRFSSSRETLAALTEKRRAAPAREVFHDDAPPLPQYDPSDEAGFDTGISDSFDRAGNDVDAPGISLAAALDSLPASIRNLVRERFHAEFSRVRSSRKVFSARDFGAERNLAEEEELSEDPDDI